MLVFEEGRDPHVLYVMAEPGEEVPDRIDIKASAIAAGAEVVGDDSINLPALEDYYPSHKTRSILSRFCDQRADE